jgi:hypothetical protein
MLTKTSDSEPLVKYIIGINSIIFDRMVSFDKTWSFLKISVAILPTKIMIGLRILMKYSS